MTSVVAVVPVAANPGAAQAAAVLGTRQNGAYRAWSLPLQVPLMDRLAPTMLAGLVSLSAGFTAFDASFAPPARADSEEEVCERLQAPR